MSWDRFSEGASKGFDEFMDVIKGDTSIEDAMKDIKDYFEDDDE
jgi:hypothetical protein